MSIDEDEAKETIDLLNDARESLNINENRRADSGTKRGTQKEPNTNAAKKSKTTSSVGSNQPRSSAPISSSRSSNPTPSFLNSSKWGKEIRPPFLQDDEVFNGLSLEAAATQIMSWMSTKAVMAANELKEKKANNAGGKEKADELLKLLQL